MSQRGRKPGSVVGRRQLIGLAAISTPAAKFRRTLTEAVREGCPADVMRDFFLAITMGHDPVVTRNQKGELYVSIQGGGIAPTMQQKADAMKWLSDRGHGTPVQTVQLEAQIKQTQADNPVFDVNALAALTPHQLEAARSALRLLTQGPPPVIDVPSEEEDDE